MRGLLEFLLLLGSVAPAAAAPEGTLTYGLHVTLAARWLAGGRDGGAENGRSVNSAFVPPML